MSTGGGQWRAGPQEPWSPQGGEWSGSRPGGAPAGGAYGGTYGDPGWPDGLGRGGPPVTATTDDRTWAMAAHLASFLAAYVALGFLAPLVVLLVRGSRSPFVARHARESLNFQLTSLAVAVVGGIGGFLLTFLTLGLAAVVVAPVALAWVVFYLVVVLLASKRAYDGRDFRYPLTVRFLR